MKSLELVELLIQENKTISFAESVTGGGLSYALINCPGASQVISFSIVAYDELTKINELAVKQSTIDLHSIVSKEVAVEMATGMNDRSKANYAVGITGNAGPTFQKKTNEKKVFIALTDKLKTVTKSFDFSINASRKEILNQLPELVFEFIIEHLKIWTKHEN